MSVSKTVLAIACSVAGFVFGLWLMAAAIGGLR
jgi:hypothetical protein